MGPRRRQSFVSMMLGVLTIGIAASGCATGSETRHGLGAGEWQAGLRLPTTASPIHELAYGHGGSSTPSVDAIASLESDTPDAVLQPAVSTPAPLAKVTPKRVTQHTSSAPVQAVAAPEPAAAPVVVSAPAEATQLASNDADARYEARQAQADEQQKFRGGDAIVISAGALVVVLLIVILILLLR